eukprot:GHVU01138080.1.p2 GENE.GHVU01138080.1~~GHVU01138080.1.p2  ORF type:complete len:128 (-),score=12.03 GHVU01138080.1:297-680(-)
MQWVRGVDLPTSSPSLSTNHPWGAITTALSAAWVGGEPTREHQPLLLTVAALPRQSIYLLLPPILRKVRLALRMHHHAIHDALLRVSLSCRPPVTPFLPACLSRASLELPAYSVEVAAVGAATQAQQ